MSEFELFSWLVHKKKVIDFFTITLDFSPKISYIEL